MQKRTKTSQRQISLFTEENATSSQEASLVNLTHSQVSDLERTMTDTSGQKCVERFGKFSRHGLWAKMFSELLIGQAGWFSTRCRLTWKLKGTKFKRMYFQLQVSTLPTDVTGFGLLPTPTVMDTNCGDLERIDQRRERAKSTSKNGNGFGTTIGELANRGLLPTPRANKVNGCDLNSENLANRNKGNLEETIAGWVVNKLLPTPTADDNPAKNTGKRNQDGLQKRAFQTTGKTSQLNPRFVMEMMGFNPNHCDDVFESILMDKLQKIKSTKSFKKQQTNGRKKQSKPEETQ